MDKFETSLNEYERAYLDRPSLVQNICAVCGKKATNKHHVIVKGMGGVSKESEKRIPLISLCGNGNVSGCHGDVHKGHIVFKYFDYETHPEWDKTTDSLYQEYDRGGFWAYKINPDGKPDRDSPLGWTICKYESRFGFYWGNDEEVQGLS